MAGFQAAVPWQTSQDVLDAIHSFNTDPAVDAYIVQLPLPKGLDEGAALLAIDPNKDADGLHPVNLGRLVMGVDAPIPCTPAGIGFHHYTFLVMATDLEPGAMAAGMTREEATAALTGHVKGSTGIVGLFGRPTLEQNVETLFWIRDIVEKGAAWVTSQGRHERKGFRSFSVSGRVKNPGVKFAPAGITVKQLIGEYCGGMQAGHKFYAYLPGGASGGILPAKMGDIPLDFDTLNQYGCFIGSAAVIILSEQDKAAAAAKNIMKFFSHESCGQCTPCRVGTQKALNLMDKSTWDQSLLEELSGAMADASICGLGQAAPNPIRCVMKYFPKEIQ